MHFIFQELFDAHILFKIFVFLLYSKPKIHVLFVLSFNKLCAWMYCAFFFFIMFLPVKNKNWKCLYFSGVEVDLDGNGFELPLTADRLHAISSNPVVCAWFFHLTVTLILNVLLCPDDSFEGLFGPVSMYYSTVEAQERLTLHLHLLVWLKGMPSLTHLQLQLLDDIDLFKQKTVR